MTQAYQPGDLVFFFGTGFLSDLIHLVAGGPSHVAMILDPSFVSDDGAGLGGPYIAESTIEGRIDGVQVNSLPLRIRDYDRGGAIALCRLDPKIRALINWDAVWKLFYGKANRDKYEKLSLVQYLTRRLPFLQYIAHNDPKAEVCSELVAMMLGAGGLPGLDSFETSPQGLFSMRMYHSIEWLFGEPRSVKTFNSR